MEPSCYIGRNSMTNGTKREPCCRNVHDKIIITRTPDSCCGVIAQGWRADIREILQTLDGRKVLVLDDDTLVWEEHTEKVKKMNLNDGSSTVMDLIQGGSLTELKIVSEEFFIDLLEQEKGVQGIINPDTPPSGKVSVNYVNDSGDFIGSILLEPEQIEYLVPDTDEE